MKKSVLVLSALSALFAISFTSCQKDKVVATSFTASLEECQDDDGKTAFTNGTLQWVSGDQIKVFDTVGQYGVYQATVCGNGEAVFHCIYGDVGEAPYRAIYPASVANDVGTVELPELQVTDDGSLTGFPMYAESDGSNLDFKNLCGVLRMRLQKSGVSITAIEVTGDIELTGNYQVECSDEVPTLEYYGYCGQGTKTTMMTCRTPQSIASQKDFYIFLPAHTYGAGMRIRIYSSDGGVCTKTVTAGHSVNIQRGKITTITLRDNSLIFAPNAGALPGLFTIDEQGHKVRFSQGNLQYTTLGVWRFALEQYEYADRVDRIPNWIDRFGWGTGNNPTLHSTDNSNYSIFVDWGANSVSNGGNAANLWRTLTQSEWQYLFNNHQCGTGNIDGIGGVIVLPDSWTLPAGCSFTAGFADDWSLNSYTLPQWTQMEAAGALFLVAGFRGGLIVDPVGRYGYYWSSTPGDDESFAKYVTFSSGYIYAWNDFNFSNHYRASEFSVRLVQDSN